MKLPQWLRARPVAVAELAFIRRWAAVLCAPVGPCRRGGVGAARQHLPRHEAMDHSRHVGRLRRAGGIYLLGFVIYLLTHNLRWWALGQ